MNSSSFHSNPLQHHGATPIHLEQPQELKEPAGKSSKYNVCLRFEAVQRFSATQSWKKIPAQWVSHLPKLSMIYEWDAFASLSVIPSRTAERELSFHYSSPWQTLTPAKPQPSENHLKVSGVISMMLKESYRPTQNVH